MKENFALDVDGVLLNIIPGALDFVRERYDMYLSEEDVTDWDWDYIWSLPDGLNAEFWQRVWNTPAKPYEGAAEFVEALKAMEFNVMAISTRPEEWKGIGRLARDAAERDFPQLGFDEVYTVDRHAEKVEIVNTTKAMFMVEDNPKNATQIGTHTNARSFLMTRPWNETCLTVAKSWERVDTYEDILREVSEAF